MPAIQVELNIVWV